MDVDQLKPEPITSAVEDAVVTFHLAHPDTIPRSLARKIHALSAIPSFPEALQEHANKVSSSSKHRELREIESHKYSVSVKRLARARQVASNEEELYKSQLETVLDEIKREELALKEETKMLAEQERIKESHGKVATKLKELSSRPKQRNELDQLIANVTTEIEEQQVKKAAYYAEAQARREAFRTLNETLQSIIQHPRVDPERSVSELPTKEKEAVVNVVGLSRASSPRLGMAPGVASKGKNTPTGSVNGDSLAEKRLDPKAAVFTPTISVQPPAMQRSNTGSGALPYGKTTLPAKPGLPNRPVGSYKDLPVSKSAGTSRNLNMATASSAPPSRSATPLARERERSANPPNNNKTNVRSNGNGNGNGRNGPPAQNRPTLDVSSHGNSTPAVPMSQKKSGREEGEMSDREEGELSSVGASNRSGLKRGRGNQSKEGDGDPKRRRMDGKLNT